MTYTAKDAISGAFRQMGQQTQFKSANDLDYDVALPSLNSMLSTWFLQGLRLAYNTNSLGLNDPVPMADFTRDAVEYNLALLIFPKFAYNQSPSAQLVTLASDKLNEIWSIGGSVPHSVFPSTLPIGSGNEFYQYGNQNPFYPDCDDKMYGCNDNQLSSQSGVILTGVDNE